MPDCQVKRVYIFFKTVRGETIFIGVASQVCDASRREQEVYPFVDIEFYVQERQFLI